MNPDYTIYTSYRYDVVPTIVGPIVPILKADFRTDRIFLKKYKHFHWLHKINCDFVFKIRYSVE